MILCLSLIHICFKELMQMFDRLDQIVYRYRNGLQKKEDAVFLKEQGITDTRCV